MRRPARALRLAPGALAAGALVLAACDPGSIGVQTPGPCTEPGALCQLPDGPLGVCERARCSAGRGELCYECTPQH